MVKSNSEIIEDIRSDQFINDQEGVCGIRTSTWDAKAHDLRGCGLNIGLTETDTLEMGNHAIKRQVCTLNLKKIAKFLIKH